MEVGAEREWDAVYQTRSAVAQFLGLSPDKVRAQFYSGSNTSGSSCYVEAALAAALISKELGRPVRIQLSREDEFGWDNYGPAHLADLRGAVDENGTITAYEYQGWGHGSPGPTTVAQLALEPSRLCSTRTAAVYFNCAFHRTICMTFRIAG
jgi:CO/xanthine dehydrogenase Mo-binding subunit